MGFLKWFVLGLVVGLLTAPRAGRDTLNMLKETFSDYAGETVDMAKERSRQMADQVRSNGSVQETNTASDQSGSMS